MKLLTARNDEDAPQVYVEGTLGWVPIAGASDLGRLLRAGQAGFAEARAAIGEERPGIELDQLHLAPPITMPRAIVCIGRNYVEHAAEGGEQVPAFPIIFPKFANALLGAGEAVIYPRITRELDYEGELCAVIGRRAHQIGKEEALEYVAGYTIMNDISARDLQLGDVQWTRGKSLDTFAPTGPYLVTKDEAGEIRDMHIETRVNGDVRQSAPCADMVFDVPTLLEFITEGITLEPGDLVATGTPAGTGIGSTPPRYMQPGDIVEVSITKLGTLRNEIVAADA